MLDHTIHVFSHKGRHCRAEAKICLLGTRGAPTVQSEKCLHGQSIGEKARFFDGMMRFFRGSLGAVNGTTRSELAI
jgi:hypothetical protein